MAHRLPPPRTFLTLLRARRPVDLLLLTAAFFVTVGAAFAIQRLSARADAARHVQVSLARIGEHAFHLDALEWEALHRGAMDAAGTDEIDAVRRVLRLALADVAAADPPLPSIDGVTDAYTIYVEAVDDEVRLLRFGAVVPAERLDAERVDPAFDIFIERLDEADEAYAALAERGLQGIFVSSFLLAFGAATLLGLLAIEYQRRQAHAEVAASEHRILSQANAELERRVEERTAEIAALHRKIIVSARQAGMAEVANGVLHNVGNVLNSVNVSTTLLLELLGQSRLADLPAAAALLTEHADHLPEFFAQDERGRVFPAFLTNLAEQWRSEQERLGREAQSLNRHIQHIREIVLRQQASAGASGLIEVLPLASVVEDAMALCGGLLRQHRVDVECDFPRHTTIRADRSKLTQILVNLLRNASQALAECNNRPRRVSIRTHAGELGRVILTVEDNGMGIHPDHLTRIFAYGFTTKAGGHGFGLHGSALAADEMGAHLTVTSAGVDQGARFVLDLPASEPATRESAA